MNIDHIPQNPGVYIFCDRNNQILYIGKAKNLHKRVSQYFAPNSLRKKDMTAKADHIDFVIVESDEEAILLETNLILKHKPPYNRLIKGDNSYIYIKIENGNFPNIYMTRYRSNDGAIYIGPKQFRNELKDLLGRFRQLRKYRSCKKTQFEQGKLCSDYMFGICKGWCVYNKLKTNSKINNKNKKDNLTLGVGDNKYLIEAEKLGFVIDKSKYTYNIYIDEYQKIINYITDFFAGNDDTIKRYIYGEIESCVSVQNFEWAARLRDIYNNIDKFVSKQSIYLNSPISGQFWQIRQVGQYWIYIVVNYQLGRIVDILRFDDRVDDVDSDAIIAKIKMERGPMIVKSENISDVSTNIYGYNEGLEVGDDEINTIYGQMENFVQSYILSSVYKKDNIMSDLLGELQNRYNLAYYPYAIECLDISHLSGGRASAGISSMQGGIKYAAGYRHYKISTDAAGDDFASIREVLIRRFDNWIESKYINLPNLFVIDGAISQLGVAKQILADAKYKYIYDNVQFVGLGKGSARKSGQKILGEKEILYILGRNGEVSQKEFVYDDADRILTNIRDEAHRFGNKYRKKQMSQEIKDQ